MKPKVIITTTTTNIIHEFAWLFHSGTFIPVPFFWQIFQILFCCFDRSAWRTIERMCELDFAWPFLFFWIIILRQPIHINDSVSVREREENEIKIKRCCCDSWWRIVFTFYGCLFLIVATVLRHDTGHGFFFYLFGWNHSSDLTSFLVDFPNEKTKRPF